MPMNPDDMTPEDRAFLVQFAADFSRYEDICKRNLHAWVRAAGPVRPLPETSEEWGPWAQAEVNTFDPTGFDARRVLPTEGDPT